MRLLLVEDSPRLQATVALGLRKAGYAVDVSDDEEDALWRAREDSCDLVILNVMLPKMNGLTVLRKVAEDLPHIFEPLWRKDPARTDGTHCCVALALVKAYMDALGATVRAELVTPELFRMTVSFPARPGESRGVVPAPT